MRRPYNSQIWKNNYALLDASAGMINDRDENTWQYRDQQDQRPTTRRIVSTAGAAAWLTPSKRRDTRMMSVQGNQSNE